MTPHEGWIGKSVADFEAATGTRAALFTRFGTGQLPQPSTLIQSGDTLHVLATDEHRRPAARHRRPRTRGGGPMRVAIAGAGAVGRSIARELLDKKHEVLLIDKDPAKVLPDRIKGASWLLGDACELANLEEARLEDCDVVVGATGDDKANLVVSLLAKTEFAVNRVVARINHPANEWLFTEAWGVDVAVSTPRVLASLVEEAVEVGDVVRLFGIREGQANLVELTLPDNAPCAGTAGPRPVAAEGHHAGRDRARPAGDHARRRRSRSRPATNCCSSRCPTPRTRYAVRSSPAELGQPAPRRRCTTQKLKPTAAMNSG